MIKKVRVQLDAHSEDANFFKEKQKEYRNEGKYAAQLFKEMIEYYKETTKDNLL